MKLWTPQKPKVQNLSVGSRWFSIWPYYGLRLYLKNLIGIHSKALSERYLSITTVVGRSKDGAFKHLHDRSWGKVGGWKGQGSSNAGRRETLVKSVLQAVVTYLIGCFQISKGSVTN